MLVEYAFLELQKCLVFFLRYSITILLLSNGVSNSAILQKVSISMIIRRLGTCPRPIARYYTSAHYLLQAFFILLSKLFVHERCQPPGTSIFLSYSSARVHKRLGRFETHAKLLRRLIGISLKAVTMPVNHQVVIGC